MNEFVNIGYFNYLPSRKILLLMDYQMRSVRRLVNSTKKESPSKILDLTNKRKCLTVIILDNGTLVLSIVPRKQIVNRICKIDTNDEVAPKSAKPRRAPTEEIKVVIQEDEN